MLSGYFFFRFFRLIISDTVICEQTKKNISLLIMMMMKLPDTYIFYLYIQHRRILNPKINPNQNQNIMPEQTKKREKKEK